MERPWWVNLHLLVSQQGQMFFCVTKDSLCVLMCVCACEHAFTCACRHLCTYGCRHEEPEYSTGCLTQSLSTLYFETRSLSEPKDPQLGQADWSVSSWELPVFVYIPPSPGIAGMPLHTWLFLRALGDLHSGPRAGVAGTLPTECLPSSTKDLD